MNPHTASGTPPRRNPLHERQERLRYALLARLRDEVGDECTRVVSGQWLGEQLGLSRAETFRIVEYLAHHHYIEYVGAGPRICLRRKGIDYLKQWAGRRRSLRTPRSPA